MCFDAPEAPKTDPAQIELARQQGAMSREMLDYTKERDKLNDARQKELQEKYLDPYMQQQMADSKKASERADEQYEYYINTGRPALQRMINDANNYDSEAALKDVRNHAYTDAEQAFSNNLGALSRNAARSGVDPTNGRYAAAQGDMASQLALAKITAANTFTQGMKKDGMNARAAVGGMANGFGNQSINFSASGTNSGNAGIGAGQASFGNQLSVQNARTAGTSSASGIAGQAGNAYGNIFNQNMASAQYGSQNSTGAALGQLAGMGIKAYSAGMFG